MSDSADARRRDARDALRVRGFDEYVAARERFFHRLRADAEIHRLERAWRLPAATGRGRLGEHHPE